MKFKKTTKTPCYNSLDMMYWNIQSGCPFLCWSNWFQTIHELFPEAKPSPKFKHHLCIRLEWFQLLFWPRIIIQMMLSIKKIITSRNWNRILRRPLPGAWARILLHFPLMLHQTHLVLTKWGLEEKSGVLTQHTIIILVNSSPIQS